jgi:hypothetical protein
MRNPLPLTLTLVFLVGTVPALPCTVVYYADDETALAGNNEDFFFPYTQATFFPPEEGKHGGVYFGYQARHGVDFGAHQGGVNDHGLFFDGLATDSVPVTRSQDKESYAGNLLKKMLEECATVEEALALFDRYDLSFMAAFQLMIGDKSGDAAIIEGDAVIRKKGDYQVATNFYQSMIDPSHASCSRYRTAVQMLRAGEGRTVDSMRDILDAVHAERDGVHTVYSNVYDLKRGLIHVYHFHDFANVVTFDLAAELAKGPHTYELASLFPENDGFLAFEEIQLARLEYQKQDQRDAFARYLADIRKPGEDRVASPSAEDVLARYIEVIGGHEALDKIRSRVTRAELTLDLMVGLSSQTTRFNGHSTMWHMRPGSLYQRIELDGGIIIERGTDGHTCWQAHSHRAGRLLEGDEKAALLLEAALDPYPKHLYESVQCLGTTTVRGERSFKLLMTPREGQPHAAFFSKETGLLVATVSATQNENDGPQKMMSRFEEYAEVDGVLLPRQATIETTAETVLGRRHSNVVASLSYEQNVDIPAERFAVPDQIEALVEGTRRTEPTDPG